MSLISTRKVKNPTVQISEIIISNLDTGNYILNVISGYSTLKTNGCYSTDRSLIINNSAAAPNIIVVDSPVCITNNTTQLGLLIDTAFWNVNWYDTAGNNINYQVSSITVSPTVSTTYIVQFQLKGNIGCISPPLLADTATVVVINEPDTNKVTTLYLS